MELELGLELIEAKVFENNDWAKSYAYDFQCVEDVFEIVQRMRDLYGEIEDILCIWREEETYTMKSFVEYDTMDEFITKFGDSEFATFAELKFSCIERYIDFRLEKWKKKISVYSYEGSLGKRVYDPAKICYYRDDCGNIVRYDGNKCMVYDYNLEMRKWVKSRWRNYDFFCRDECYYTKIDLSDEELKAFEDI